MKIIFPDVRKSNKLILLSEIKRDTLLNYLHREQYDSEIVFEQLVDIIKCDVSVSYISYGNLWKNPRYFF